MTNCGGTMTKAASLKKGNIVDINGQPYPAKGRKATKRRNPK